VTRADARQIALDEVGRSPGIRQRELADRVHAATGLAESTIVKQIRALERDGLLESRLLGRRKAYRLADPGISTGSTRDLVLLVAVALTLASLAVILLSHT
jgi:DNA-binding transcriptional ArsR family regulator